MFVDDLMDFHGSAKNRSEQLDGAEPCQAECKNDETETCEMNLSIFNLPVFCINLH